jgi:hypothetical protein
MLTPVCATPLPLANPWDAKTLYGLPALFANNKGRVYRRAANTVAAGLAARSRSSYLCAALLGTYSARPRQEHGVDGRMVWEEVESVERN